VVVVSTLDWSGSNFSSNSSEEEVGLRHEQLVTLMLPLIFVSLRAIFLSRFFTN
jgi:hypothetical protein